MSRYIDADALMQNIPSEEIIAKMAVAHAPSIDIVFCKECKHNYSTERNHGKMHPRCDFTDWKLKENDFCSRGERRDDE